MKKAWHSPGLWPGSERGSLFRGIGHLCLALCLLLTSPSKAAGPDHPFVFGSSADLAALLALHTPSSEKALARLQAEVQSVLLRGDEVSHPYSGCALDRYLSDLTRAGGAANIAAELALYAYLSTRNQGYGDPRSAEKARSLAATILLSWADGGLRDQGAFRGTVSGFCNAQGQSTLALQLDVGLQIGRGVPYWVQAEDLLLAQHAFDDGEKRRLDLFLDDLYGLMLDASNFWSLRAYTDCERYSNHTSVHLLAMASIARLRNDGRRLADISALSPGTVKIPYPQQLEKTIYGNGSAPLECHANSENPALSHQIATVAPGELADRNRAGSRQTLGYPLFSLKELLLGVALLRRGGIDLVDFTGSHGQSLRLALDYYAYYFENFMTGQETFVPPGEDPYPSYSQYVGKQVSWADGATIEGRDETLDPFVIGYSLYPDDRIIASVIGAAFSFDKGLTPLYGFDPLVIEYMAGLARRPPAP